MKNLLTVLALSTFVATPVLFTAELFGSHVPAALGSGTVGAIFVAASLALTFAADYRRASKPRAYLAAATARKSEHALAA
jgi:hypothetical protein